MIAVSLPLKRLRVRSGFAVCVGLFAFGCLDELGKDLKQTKPDPSTKPSTGSTMSSVPQDAGPGDAQAGDPCENNVQDPGETALNCGGVCQPCGVGLSCEENSDCATGLCKDKVCLAKGCDNGTVDGNESDTDCGMGCVLCGDGKTCKSDADCQSKVCAGDDEKRTCQVPTCEDKRMNGAETAVDCGPGCEPCENGLACTGDEHCQSGACVSNVCADPGCTDGEPNGSETDQDCGGRCPKCTDDLKCNEGSDCQSGICAAVTSKVKRCVEATCNDDALNGRESDLNCGGMCDPCEDGKRCFLNADCLSLVCTLVEGEDYSQCSAPTCEDEVRNGTESAPDCGGTCGGCDVGLPCRNDDDCESAHCDSTTKLCLAATCEDGRQNQGESDEDCGGPCGGCDVGQLCKEDEDCKTARCNDVCEAGGAGAACVENEECITGSCGNDNKCAEGYAGDGCYEASDCALGECGDDNKCPKGYTGAACDGDSGCYSGACVGAVCGVGGVGAACVAPTDCVSNSCNDDDKCDATRMTLRSQGTTETFIKMQVWLRANSQDPSVTWANLALLYFFTPEVHGNFYYKVYGLDAGNRSDRFFARRFSEATGSKPFGDWAAIWRSAPINTNAIPNNQESDLEFQVYNEPNGGLVNANDHSYQSGNQANPNIVVCVRRDGRWVHAQGTPPAGSGDVCALVVDSCPDTETCDLLEWRD